MKTVQMDNETRRIISGFINVLRDYNAQNVYKKDLTDEETISDNEMKNRYISYVNDIITNKQAREWTRYMKTYDDYVSDHYDAYDCLYNELYNDYSKNKWDGNRWEIRNKYRNAICDYHNPNYDRISTCYDELADIIYNRASNKAVADKESEEAEIES